MKREDKILKLVNKGGYGVEVGPSYNPVAPQKAGYKVHVIDQMNREQSPNRASRRQHQHLNV